MTHSEPPSASRPPRLKPALEAWFTQPPRAHGDFDEERTVSFLELFYDLVFVVLIAQVAHTLAGDVSWSGVRDFVIVFGLIWIAWVNGSLYYELHAREDGRARSFIFAQMLLLVVLAVYAGHATTTDGRGFATTYAILMALLTWQWWLLRAHDDETFRRLTGWYVMGNLVVIALIVASAVVAEPDVRLILWFVVVLGTVGFSFYMFAVRTDGTSGILVTDSMSERFGLFTIIVLGEVVVGVADGLAEAHRDATTIATGLTALGIGFGFWWMYFDFAGRRVPRPGRPTVWQWLYSHLPMALSIAAAGAAMVSLIEHAGDARAPAGTAWLISGSTAVMLLSLAAVIHTLADDNEVPPSILIVGAAAALVPGVVRPSPLILVIALTLMLSVVWLVGFARRHGAALHRC